MYAYLVMVQVASIHLAATIGKAFVTVVEFFVIIVIVLLLGIAMRISWDHYRNFCVIPTADRVTE